MGGSTNAVIHLTAIAGRLGIRVSLARLNELSDTTPVLVDLKPTGAHYMEDFFAAGGMSAVLHELKPLLDLYCIAVTGERLRDRLAAPPEGVDRAVIRSLTAPLHPVGGLVALFGSLAPNGAILKRSAAEASLFERQGRAVVFTSPSDLAARIDDPALDVGPDDFLVMQNAGPKSGYGMPEAGYLPLPAKLARAGRQGHGADFRRPHERHCLRHGRPARFARGRRGRPARAGAQRRSNPPVRARTAARPRGQRRGTRAAPGGMAAAVPAAKRGYQRLYAERVLQAEDGCDFDFLRA